MIGDKFADHYSLFMNGLKEIGNKGRKVGMESCFMTMGHIIKAIFLIMRYMDLGNTIMDKKIMLVVGSIIRKVVKEQ